VPRDGAGVLAEIQCILCLCLCLSSLGPLCVCRPSIVLYSCLPFGQPGLARHVPVGAHARVPHAVNWTCLRRAQVGPDGCLPVCLAVSLAGCMCLHNTVSGCLSGWLHVLMVFWLSVWLAACACVIVCLAVCLAGCMWLCDSLPACAAAGCFHEDGLSDCFDGFGGGWGKVQILRIMKDSRIGTYALVGPCCSGAPYNTHLHALHTSGGSLLLRSTVQHAPARIAYFPRWQACLAHGTCHQSTDPCHDAGQRSASCSCHRPVLRPPAGPCVDPLGA
jgi:hypothetical protein